MTTRSKSTSRNTTAVNPAGADLVRMVTLPLHPAAVAALLDYHGEEDGVPPEQTMGEMASYIVRRDAADFVKPVENSPGSFVVSLPAGYHERLKTLAGVYDGAEAFILAESILHGIRHSESLSAAKMA